VRNKIKTLGKFSNRKTPYACRISKKKKNNEDIFCNGRLTLNMVVIKACTYAWQHSNR